jgi:hypothetical protein
MKLAEVKDVQSLTSMPLVCLHFYLDIGITLFLHQPMILYKGKSKVAPGFN